LGAALETPGPERQQFLDSACANDADLRSEVAGILAGAQETSWQSPAAEWSAAAAEFAPGDTLAHFRVEARLGAGGMGVVYRAYDSKLHRNVALKVLPPADLAEAGGRLRLIREARAASALNHPNIVTVYEIGSEGGTDFIVMECIEGQSLGHAIAAQRLPSTCVLDYAIQIAAALAKAHASGIIHRDLKPANIMLTADGHIKLLDFGLAQRSQVTDSAVQMATMAEGEIAGTVGYISPEQLGGLAVDGRTDLFALGVILYEMATGERPFQGDSRLSVIEATLHTEPRDFGADVVPGRLKAIIFKLGGGLSRTHRSMVRASMVARALGSRDCCAAGRAPDRADRVWEGAGLASGGAGHSAPGPDSGKTVDPIHRRGFLRERTAGSRDFVPSL
jgi:serine/threonine protein kinase